MAHPVVHAEIRSQDPDATRRFFADLFGWKIASEGAFPGYTFIDTGAPGGTFVAISPRQSTEDEVLFFVAVEDVEATLARAEQLGGSIVQPAQHVPGTSFGVFADAQGHKVGVASTGELDRRPHRSEALTRNVVPGPRTDLHDPIRPWTVAPDAGPAARGQRPATGRLAQ